jgi:hypothetical protein
MMLADLRFRRTAPTPGDPFPEFDLVTTEGGRVRSPDFSGPFVLILGSLTCPMTASAASTLNGLAASFGGKIPFLTVYTREAHPGECIPQPDTLAQKTVHARQLAERDGYTWQVAVDDIDGTLHRALDSKPNAAFVVDGNGILAFRALWSSDSKAIEEAIRTVLDGETPRRQSSTRMVAPMMRALPRVDRTVSDAGRTAMRDLWRAAAPMALMGKAARRWPTARGR